jgi:hypothetical protein
MNIVIGRMQIKYPNGLEQEFNIVSAEAFDLSNYTVEGDKDSKNDAAQRRAKVLKPYEPFCVENSPIHASLNTGYMSLPPAQGGKIKVESKLL